MLDKTSTTPLYFVELDFGKNGTEFAPLDRLTNSRANVIESIISGEYERPLCVLEAWEGEGRLVNVSEDIAREICDRVIDGDPLPMGGLRDFIEEHLGCQHMADLIREVEAA